MASKELEKLISDVKKKAWKAFKMIVERILGNNQRDDYDSVI